MYQTPQSITPAPPGHAPESGDATLAMTQRDRKALLKQMLKAGLLVIACDALKLPFTAPIVFLYFLYLYRQHRPGPVDLMALWLVVSPLMGPYGVMEVGGLPAIRFQWCFVILLLVSLSREPARARFPSNGLDASMILLCCVCIASIVNSIMYRTPFRTFLDATLVPMGFYVVAKRCIRRPDFLPKIYLAAMIGILAFGALGLYEAFTENNILDYGESKQDVFRVNGPMRMAEDYGICMNMLIVFCIAMHGLAKTKLLQKRTRWVAFAVGTVAVFFTVTRGIWLSLISGGAVLFARRKTATFLVAVPILAVVAWGLFDVVIPQFSGDLWEKRVTNQKTINARFATYKSAWLMFQDHPFLGVGFGAFGEVQERNEVYQTDYNGEPAVDTPHNYFLSIVSETGLLGMVAVLFMLAYAMRYSLWTFHAAPSKTHRDYGEAMIAITVAYLVAGLGNDFTRNIDFVNKFFFAFLGGISGMADQLRENEWRAAGIRRRAAGNPKARPQPEILVASRTRG